MTIAKFTDWIISRWDGGQPAQQMRHPIPFSPIAAMGLAGEIGEVVQEVLHVTNAAMELAAAGGRSIELLKKHARDGKHPSEALKLELGDALHYLTVIAAAYGWSLDDIALGNMDKLIERDRAKAEIEAMEARRLRK
jgi:NTP pyrophosphatase (non-canonical NTP hydrolase)